MKEYFFKDIFYLSIVRVFAFANVPLQTFIFATFLTAELIQYFFILAGLFSILVVFEGGAGTVLTYEYNRRLGNQKELTFLVEYFRRRFFKLTIYYIISAIAAFLLYNSMFSGMLNEYTYQYIFCVLMMGLSFNLYPIICISEGYGYVRQALLVKSIAPILSMLVYLIYVVTLKDIKAIYIIPTVTFFCYSIYILFNCKFLAVDYFALRKTNNEHAISHNVSKANVSWTAGYVLTQGFPLLLPFVLSATEAAQLLLTSNLLNAFLSFTCIGATVIGPRIPHMIEKNDLSYKNFVIKNLIFIYSVLILCLIFFDDLLDIFYLIFDNEKFLNKDLLLLFCISCGYIPLYHFSVILLKGRGIEPFVNTNVYVAISTALLVLICSITSVKDFLYVYILFRLSFVTLIYIIKMLKYYYALNKKI